MSDIPPFRTLAEQWADIATCNRLRRGSKRYEELEYVFYSGAMAIVGSGTVAAGIPDPEGTRLGNSLTEEVLDYMKQFGPERN